MATNSQVAAALAEARARQAAATAGSGGRWRPWVGAFLVLLLGLAGIAAYGTGYSYVPAVAVPESLPGLEIPADAKALRKNEAQLKARQRQILAALDKKAPKGIYIVVDQTQNRLYLRKDDEVIREAICSAGSGMVLQGPKNNQKWVFDTPRGVYKVQSKIENPVWKKPDWAFYEEGQAPPKDPSERFDPGALGAYALYLGNGYMIHGTLYERLLGRSVTHGCIRLGHEDLEVVFHAASIGTPVYIY